MSRPYGSDHCHRTAIVLSMSLSIPLSHLEIDYTLFLCVPISFIHSSRLHHANVRLCVNSGENLQCKQTCNVCSLPAFNLVVMGISSSSFFSFYPMRQKTFVVCSVTSGRLCLFFLSFNNHSLVYSFIRTYLGFSANEAIFALLFLCQSNHQRCLIVVDLFCNVRPTLPIYFSLSLSNHLLFRTF